MDQFIAQILAKLDARQAESDLKNLTKDRDINLKIKLTGDTDLLKSFQSDFNSLSSAAEKAGTNAGRSYATAMQKQIETVAKTQRNAFSEPLGNMSKSQKSYSDWWNKELSKQETVQKRFQKEQEKIRNQELNQIRAVEESKKRIQVQQQIAALKANAVQKNAHYNSLVQQGKDNLARLKQEYEDQNKYLQKYELYKSKLDNLKSTVSKDSSLLGSSGYDKITSQINQAEQAIQSFNAEIQKGESANFNNLTNDLKEVNSLTQKATREYQKLTTPASAIDQQNFINQLKKYENENARAVKYGKPTWDNIVYSANAGNLSSGQLADIKAQFKSFDLEMQAAGKTGKSFFQEIQRGFKKIGEFAYTYGAIQKVENALTSSIDELKSIDTIITEISKAADVPVKQLKELGSNSFDVASKYGQKASDYLLGVQEMTRAGYSDTAGMAELSTLAQSAGDMTAELANQYLIASDMAFGYGGNVEKLNALLDSQNQINKMVC